MNPFNRFLRHLSAAGLGLVFSLLALVTAPALSAPALAASSSSTASLPFAASAGRVKAASKDFEGKTQESIAKVTGDRGDLLAGKAKQAEAKVRNAVEDVKDKTGLG